MKKNVTFISGVLILASLSACGEKAIDDTAKSNLIAEETPASVHPSANEKQWKQFLRDYDAWIDHYVDVIKKFSENPKDPSVISDYAKLMEELSQWQEKSAGVQAELENASPRELAEYTAELLKIISKLSDTETE